MLHIEAISHTAGIHPSGGKTFQTTLSVSHGVEGEGRQAIGANDSEAQKRAQRFPGTDDNETDLAVSQTNVTLE